MYELKGILCEILCRYLPLIGLYARLGCWEYEHIPSEGEEKNKNYA